MRCLIILAMAAMLAAPAYAANPNAQASGAPAASAPHKAKAPSAKAPQKAPAETVAKALAAGDKAPADVTGRLVQKVEGKKTRYIFEDNTGRMTVGMGKKAVEQGVPAPGATVRLKGAMRQKDGKPAIMVVKSMKVMP